MDQLKSDLDEQLDQVKLVDIEDNSNNLNKHTLDEVEKISVSVFNSVVCGINHKKA